MKRIVLGAIAALALAALAAPAAHAEAGVFTFSQNPFSECGSEAGHPSCIDEVGMWECGSLTATASTLHAIGDWRPFATTVDGALSAPLIYGYTVWLLAGNILEPPYPHPVLAEHFVSKERTADPSAFTGLAPATTYTVVVGPEVDQRYYQPTGCSWTSETRKASAATKLSAANGTATLSASGTVQHATKR